MPKRKKKEEHCAREPIVTNTVVSGSRPTGDLHLGHLHGAIRNWLKFQDAYSSYFFVADWHALTTEYADPSGIQESTRSMVLDWLAVGLDPERSVIFRQSAVAEHAELHLILSMIVPVPLLERVPTYKEQQQQLSGKDLSTYGFLGYPLLQAADILVYKGDRVPVGEDQLPHVELTRAVARKFNNLYGEVFPEPSAEIVSAAKVPGTDGRKMSKSYGNTVNLRDDPDTVHHKLARMVTDPARKRLADPGDPVLCPAFRLHEIYCTEEEKAELTEACKSASIGCLDCKKVMIKHVLEDLDPIRERRTALEASPGLIEDVLDAGAKKARVAAVDTMADVRKRVGVR